MPASGTLSGEVPPGETEVPPQVRSEDIRGHLLDSSASGLLEFGPEFVSRHGKTLDEGRSGHRSA